MATRKKKKAAKKTGKAKAAKKSVKAAKKKSATGKARKSARKAPVKKTAKKKSARKAAPAKAAKAAAPRKAKKPAAKKPVAKKKAQIVGEGDYAASRAFLSDQAAFVKRNKAAIPEMGKDAEAALDGPEGAALRAAEAEAASRAKD
jgi:hypothetical protein